MRVVLAQSAGFCYGVRRAVELADETAARGELPCVMLGPIIHNMDVVGRLTRQGLGVADSLDQVPDGCGVIIRSHGENINVISTEGVGTEFIFSLPKSEVEDDD